MSQSRRSERARTIGRTLLGSALAVSLAPLPAAVSAASGDQPARRQIEEVLVTAEKRESSIQDTSISISAFEGEFLADFGIRNQEDLANFIPATTIQPYDMAVRGIGRSFRALGGDPGIATYFDGVYSEDFGIASTEGGLWDIDRIEVLRGPQGTLYGRNAVGGAINFITNAPTDYFEGAFKTNIGTHGLFETYGMLSGPIVPGLLNARATSVKRERDGFYDDQTQGNQDVGNYGDENYTLALEFTPTDTFSMKLRGNERSYRRRMGGAGQLGGVIALSENGDQGRDTTSEVFGLRPVLSTDNTPLAGTFDPSQGAAALAASGNPAVNTTDPTASNFIDQNAALFQFTNPATGETALAQPVRPGIDPNTSFAPSRNFGGGGGSFALAPTVDADGFGGDDLDTATNGNQDEFFDHQAFYFEANYDVNDRLGFKYVGGYTDYFYDRTTDRDLTGNPNADETFYVSQENENFQHEVQMFLDFGERATLTSGLFYYEARITQRGDFYSSVSEPRFAQAANYGTSPDGIPNAAILGAIFTGTDLFSAKAAYNALDAETRAGLVNADEFTVTAGIWNGDNPGNPGGCTSVPSGPVTCGSFTEYQTENRTEAIAWYNQAEIFLSDKFSLTVGLRYAEDQRSGEESVFTYTEGTPDDANAQNIVSGNLDTDELVFLSGLPQGTLAGAPTGATDANGLTVSELGAPITSTASLLQFNASTGAIDPATLQQTGNEIVRYDGVPVPLTFYRPVEETYDAWTYRVNLDYEPNDTTLIYAGVTTGYRAGGFNLANLSNSAVYDQEEITAYEIGWKDQLFDRTVQINMSAYIYDYTDVHQTFSGFSNDLGGAVNNVTNVPEARIFGIEGDVLWLATESITLGGNFSFTDSEYTSDIRGLVDTDNDAIPDTVQSLVLDEFNANVPASVFPERERTVDIEGNQMLLVPEIKWTVFGVYDVPLGNRGNVQLRSNVSYTDEVFFSIENNPVDKAPDYYRWDARVTWTSPEERFVLSGFVNNILDDIGVRQISRYAENANYLRTATPTDPRIMGMEFTWNFGNYR